MRLTRVWGLALALAFALALPLAPSRACYGFPAASSSNVCDGHVGQTLILRVETTKVQGNGIKIAAFLTTVAVDSSASGVWIVNGFVCSHLLRSQRRPSPLDTRRRLRSHVRHHPQCGKSPWCRRFCRPSGCVLHSHTTYCYDQSTTKSRKPCSWTRLHSPRP